MAIAVHRTTMEITEGISGTEPTAGVRVYPGFPSADYLVIDRPGGRDNSDFFGLRAAGVPPKHWKIVADRLVEKTAAEKATADAAELAQLRRPRQLRRIAFEVAGFLESRYTALDREVLGQLRANSPSPARLAYLAPFFVWMRSVMGARITAETAIAGSANPETVTIDFAALAATDPAITVSGALAIP
jgi:hypothetical protein